VASSLSPADSGVFSVASDHEVPPSLRLNRLEAKRNLQQQLDEAAAELRQEGGSGEGLMDLAAAEEAAVDPDADTDVEVVEEDEEAGQPLSKKQEVFDKVVGGQGRGDEDEGPFPLRKTRWSPLTGGLEVNTEGLATQQDIEIRENWAASEKREAEKPDSPTSPPASPRAVDVRG
jgi:hypothetical protein